MKRRFAGREPGEPMDSEGTSVKYVPWFNMSEWEGVYKQIYSDDNDKQVKGLEHLLLWKARVPNEIPAGVNCTVDFLQAFIKDRQETSLIESGQLPSYNERNLKFMYSVAVTRFLNHLKPVVARGSRHVMYKMADDLNIPDWIVKIRHESSHGQNLPSLDVLREAATFCFEWIHENYWKKEVHVSSDLIVNDKFSDNEERVRLKEIVEMWQSVMLYMKAGIEVCNNIPDKRIRRHISEKRRLISASKIITLKKDMLKSKMDLEDNSLLDSLVVLSLELLEFLSGFEDNMSAYEMLVDVLLEGDGFLASPEFVVIFNAGYDKNRIPPNLRKFWQVMVKYLNHFQFIPILLRKLLDKMHEDNESFHRYRMTALWLKELFLSIKKATLVRSLENNSEIVKYLPDIKSFYTLKYSGSKVKNIIKKLEKDDIKMKGIMTIHTDSIPTPETRFALLNDAINKPKSWTKLFLKSLMDIIDPPLKPEEKQKMFDVVKLYIRENPIFSDDQDLKDRPVYTVNDLLNGNAEEVIVQKSESSKIRSPGKSKSMTSDWILYEGNVDWIKCPMGRLPWQRKESIPNMKIPEDTVWQAKNPKVVKPLGSYVPGYVHEEVNWNKAVKKRPRYTQIFVRQSTDTNMLDNAFHTALNKK